MSSKNRNNTEDKVHIQDKEGCKLEAIEKMLNGINKSGYLDITIERCLRLPWKTVSKWRQGEMNTVESRLLSVIYAYPWILKVAAHGFDPEVAREELFKEVCLENY